MTSRNDKPDVTSTKRVVRLRTVIAFLLFVLFSAAVHFTIGPAMTAISPHWDYGQLPTQAVSIVTLSRREQAEPTPKPTPSPTPPPRPLPRTSRDLALLQYRELGVSVHMRTVIKPPPRRLSTIIIEKHVVPRPPPSTVTGSVVVATLPPTPEPSQPPGNARAATATSGSDFMATGFGDDNPPRLIKRAPLAIADSASGVARVEVDVGLDGAVEAVRLVQSSGDPSVDQAALDAARGSTFAPATFNGMPVHGTCTLEFSPATVPAT
jgi:TonB family protein